VAKFDEDQSKELQLIQDHFTPVEPKHMPITRPAIIQFPTQKFGH
jgi:hypothetical protein